MLKKEKNALADDFATWLESKNCLLELTYVRGEAGSCVTFLTVTMLDEQKKPRDTICCDVFFGELNRREALIDLISEMCGDNHLPEINRFDSIGLQKASSFEEFAIKLTLAG